jgi:drug/metabolite transporter (DMT)-like permease
MSQKTAEGVPSSVPGDLIILTGTVAFAIYTILEKKIAGRYEDLVLNALVFGLGAVLMFPFAILSVVKVHWAHVPVAA